MRNRRVSTSSRDQETGFAPGDLVREFGRRMGWNLVKCNVMFEGTTDVSYCNVANRLYFESTGKNLIDDDFQVMAIGERDQGGTDGIRDRLRTLQAVLQSEPSELEMSVVCVVDDDHEGRKAFADLRKKFQPWRDLFKLNRVFPRTPISRSSEHFEGEMKKANANWDGLDCDIEDLIADEIIECFISENPRCLKTEVDEKGGRFHRKFHGNEKPKLVRFVEQHASLSDLSQIVEILKSLRWLLRLDPEGS
jgi:hypothetical protein